jgi:hypothetical protein
LKLLRNVSAIRVAAILSVQLAVELRSGTECEKPDQIAINFENGAEVSRWDRRQLDLPHHGVIPDFPHSVPRTGPKWVPNQGG